MFEHANADFIQVFQETIEDRHQISCCQLVSKNYCQLMNGESQSTSHLPLRGGKEILKDHHMSHNIFTLKKKPITK